MVISLTSLLLVVFSVGFFGLLSYVVGKWLFQVDEELVKARRAAAQIAADLQERGMEKIPEFLLDVSVGDLAGMYDKLKSLGVLFKQGEEAVIKEFDLVADRVVDARLRTPEGRALLAAKLQDMAEATDPSVTKAIAATVAKAAVIAAAPASAPLAALAA